MARNRANGTPEQFLNAVKNRIGELGGSVEESTAVNAGSDCCYQDQEGQQYTLNDLKDQYKSSPSAKAGNYSFDRWLQLAQENGMLTKVTSGENCNCGEGYNYMMHDTVSASDDLDTDRYIHSLIGEVESELVDEVDGIKWDQDGENLYMTVTYGDVITELEIPFEDLDMTFANLEDDAAYIVNTVLYDLDNM